MDIVYHSSKLVLEGKDSLVSIDYGGGATIEVAESRIVDFFLRSSAADLAFCRTFLDYRAAYQKRPDGSVRVVAAIPEWQDHLKVPFLDQVASILMHNNFTGEPNAEEVGLWITKCFGDKTVKMAILTGPQRQVAIALMRNSDDLITIAGNG